MKKVKPVVARNATELAKALGLTPADAVEFEIRSALNDKIIEVVNERGLTHAQVAGLSHTSRTRVTAILNRNTHDISTGSHAASAGVARRARKTSVHESRVSIVAHVLRQIREEIENG